MSEGTAIEPPKEFMGYKVDRDWNIWSGEVGNSRYFDPFEDRVKKNPRSHSFWLVPSDEYIAFEKAYSAFVEKYWNVFVYEEEGEEENE